MWLRQRPRARVLSCGLSGSEAYQRQSSNCCGSAERSTAVASFPFSTIRSAMSGSSAHKPFSVGPGRFGDPLASLSSYTGAAVVALVEYALRSGAFCAPVGGRAGRRTRGRSACPARIAPFGGVPTRPVQRLQSLDRAVSWCLCSQICPCRSIAALAKLSGSRSRVVAATLFRRRVGGRLGRLRWLDALMMRSYSASGFCRQWYPTFSVGEALGVAMIRVPSICLHHDERIPWRPQCGNPFARRRLAQGTLLHRSPAEHIEILFVES